MLGLLTFPKRLKHNKPISVSVRSNILAVVASSGLSSQIVTLRLKIIILSEDTSLWHMRGEGGLRETSKWRYKEQLIYESSLIQNVRFFSVAEAHGLIHPRPSGENFSFAL